MIFELNWKDGKEVLRNILGPRNLFYLKRATARMARRTTISSVNLEFVNYCNLRCKWCALDHDQSRCVMSEKLLRIFFDNLFADPRFRSVRSVNLVNGGETLIHPDVIGMLTIIKEYKSRFAAAGIPFPLITLVTNAVALTEDLSRRIIDADVLDMVSFSVDGGSRQRFEELRSPARWDTVAGNIRTFIKMNGGRSKTGIICIIDYGKPADTTWMSAEFKDLCGVVDTVSLRYPIDWIGDVPVDGLVKTYQNHCLFLFHTLSILPDGAVSVCCMDLNGKGVIGNLFRETLYQLYTAPRRRAMVRDLLRGRRDRIELCRQCAGYGL